MSDPDISVHRRAVAVLIAAGALLLGACAQEASDSASTDAGGADEAADALDDADDAGDAGSADEPDLDAAIEATRAVESAELQMALEVDSPMGGGTVDLSGDLSRDDEGTVTAAAASGGDDFEVEMLADGESVWITSDAPAITDALPDGATWVEGSVDDLRADGVWTGLDTTFDVLSVLRGVDDLSESGTTEIGGDEVRLYEGDVDWDAALEESEAADPDERSALEETISLTGDPELETFTVEVGIDDDGRVRFLDVEVVAGPPGGTDDDLSLMGEITLRIELTVENIDHEVDVPDAPPAEETVPLSEVPEVADMLADGI